MSKRLASFDYIDNSLIVLSVATGSISIASFGTVVVAPVGIMSAGCSLAFSITTEFVNKFLKATTNTTKKHNKIVMLARSKLNSIDIMFIHNQQTKYRELKESIRMMNSQISDAKKVSLIKEDKKIGINEVIKCN